jgi:hypothetical protein
MHAKTFGTLTNTQVGIKEMVHHIFTQVERLKISKIIWLKKRCLFLLIFAYFHLFLPIFAYFRLF